MVLSRHVREVGVEKPDRSIFQMAMAEAPVHHPEEMMHVGDSREKVSPITAMAVHHIDKQGDGWMDGRVVPVM